MTKVLPVQWCRRCGWSWPPSGRPVRCGSAQSAGSLPHWRRPGPPAPLLHWGRRRPFQRPSPREEEEDSITQLVDPWHSGVTKITGYDFKDLTPCIGEILFLWRMYVIIKKINLFAKIKCINLLTTYCINRILTSSYNRSKTINNNFFFFWQLTYCIKSWK